MSKILEKIIDPSKIYVNSNFLLKIKVQDDYIYKKNLISENNLTIITEDRKEIRTEWGV